MTRNSTSIELSHLSMSHTRGFVVEQFSHVLKSSKISEPVKQVLKLLFEVLSIVWMLRHAGDFYRFANLKVRVIDSFTKKQIYRENKLVHFG